VRARQRLALVEPRSQSPLETATRLCMHDGGLPAPETQYEVRHGRWAPDRRPGSCTSGRASRDRSRRPGPACDAGAVVQGPAPGGDPRAVRLAPHPGHLGRRPSPASIRRMDH
jgi:hypothetical protein